MNIKLLTLSLDNEVVDLAIDVPPHAEAHFRSINGFPVVVNYNGSAYCLEDWDVTSASYVKTTSITIDIEGNFLVPPPQANETKA